MSVKHYYFPHELGAYVVETLNKQGFCCDKINDSSKPMVHIEVTDGVAVVLLQGWIQPAEDFDEKKEDYPIMFYRIAIENGKPNVLDFHENEE